MQEAASREEMNKKELEELEANPNGRAKGIVIEAQLDKLAALPMVRGYQYGPDAQLAEGNFDYVLVADFEDRAGYEAYAVDPQHQLQLQHPSMGQQQPQQLPHQQQQLHGSPEDIGDVARIPVPEENSDPLALLQSSGESSEAMDLQLSAEMHNGVLPGNQGAYDENGKPTYGSG